MISDLKTSILYKCPVCGKTQVFNLGIFSFSGNKAVVFGCKCKKSYISVQVGKNHKYILSSPCIACNEFHRFEINAKVFWNSKIICFDCPAIETDLFFAGDVNEIKKECSGYEEETDLIMHQLGYDVLNEENPFVYGVFEHLENLKSRGRLKCACKSSDIKLQMFYDRVELLCTSCLSKTVISGECADDLKRIKKLDMLEINRNENSQKNI